MIYKSASRIVFIIMTLALCVFTYKGIVDGKDFVMLISIVFTYYFTKQANENNRQAVRVQSDGT